MSKDELEILNGTGVLSEQELLTGTPEWIINTSYWLDSEYEYPYAWSIRNGKLILDYSYNTSYCGVRPVLTVSKSRLSLVPVTTATP